jgi:hypothetical protein
MAIVFINLRRLFHTPVDDIPLEGKKIVKKGIKCNTPIGKPFIPHKPGLYHRQYFKK